MSVDIPYHKKKVLHKASGSAFDTTGRLVSRCFLHIIFNSIIRVFSSSLFALRSRSLSCFCVGGNSGHFPTSFIFSSPCAALKNLFFYVSVFTVAQSKARVGTHTINTAPIDNTAFTNRRAGTPKSPKNFLKRGDGTKLLSPKKVQSPEAERPSTSYSRGESTRKRPNPPNTSFRKFYERGDLPVQINHDHPRSVQWKIEVTKLDFHHYLPMFFDGPLRQVAIHSFCIGLFASVCSLVSKLLCVCLSVFVGVMCGVVAVSAVLKACARKNTPTVS